jgi:hypothetical protein
VSNSYPGDLAGPDRDPHHGKGRFDRTGLAIANFRLNKIPDVP